MATDTPNRSETSLPNDLSEPVLFYDAKCSICEELAVKVRANSDQVVDIVALSDPLADRILDEYYPDGWSHDFYLLEGDTCHKGVRALPKVARKVGLRDFGSLMGEYASYKLETNGCTPASDCDHDHHVGDLNSDSTASSRSHEQLAANGKGLSRRSAMSAISGVALPLLSPISKLSTDTERLEANASRPTVHVARVKWDDGDFLVNIERCGDCEEAEEPEDEESKESSEEEPAVELEVIDRELLHDGSFDSKGTLQVSRTDLKVVINDPDEVDPDLLRAIEENDGVAKYNVIGDHPRYAEGYNTGYGPLVVDGDPRTETHLSGQIKHDLAKPFVDYVVYESGEYGEYSRASTHLEAYAVGMEALREFHADAGRDRLAEVYSGLAGSQRQVYDAFDENVDDPKLVPIRNHVAITGLPNFLQKTSAPRSGPEYIGWGCSCGCVCGCGCCCSCGCGCGCSFPCGCSCGCGCCCSCGCGCSCDCGCCLE